MSEQRQYAAAGVDLVSAEVAKERIGQLLAGTRTQHSVGHVGAFGGMVRVPARTDAGRGARRPSRKIPRASVHTRSCAQTRCCRSPP